MGSSRSVKKQSCWRLYGSRMLAGSSIGHVTVHVMILPVRTRVTSVLEVSVDEIVSLPVQPECLQVLLVAVG